MNFIVLVIVELLLYILCFFSTIFSVRTNKNISLWSDKSPARDTAIIINAFFLLYLALSLMLNLEGSFFVWPLIAFGFLTELLFTIPNYLDSRWKYIHRFIAGAGLLAEAFLYIKGFS